MGMFFIIAFVVLLLLLGFFFFIIAAIAAAIYKQWREIMPHQHTVVRLYFTEETVAAPEIQTILSNCTHEQLVGIVGALEVAKKSVLDCFAYEEMDEDEVEGTQGLFGGGEEEQE